MTVFDPGNVALLGAWLSKGDFCGSESAELAVLPQLERLAWPPRSFVRGSHRVRANQVTVRAMASPDRFGGFPLWSAPFRGAGRRLVS